MDLKKVNALSDTYLQNQYAEGDSCQILQGVTPIMISAPHAVGQLRHGKEKKSESYTGVLANFLHSNAGYHAIIKTRNLKDDANFDKDSSYRKDLIRYINKGNVKLLIDLHIMNSSYVNTIEMATGEGKNILNQWWIIKKTTEIARACGISAIDTDKHFFALNPNCVAADIALNCRIPAIQMEINWRDLEIKEGDNNEFPQIYKFLESLKSIF